jgi:sec-independent protein translocase protein TatA
MFENLGGAELMLVFLVILIFFGPKKIPELAASFGKGLRKFREAKAGMEEQFRTAMKEPMETMKKAQAGFNADAAEARKGFEKRVNAMMNDQTQGMRDSGEAIKAQIEEAAKAFEEQREQIPLFTAPPAEYHRPVEPVSPASSSIAEPVPGGVKIHKLI